MTDNKLQWYPEQRLRQALRLRVIGPREWTAYEDMRRTNLRKERPLTPKQLQYKHDIEHMVDSGRARQIHRI